MDERARFSREARGLIPRWAGSHFARQRVGNDMITSACAECAGSMVEGGRDRLLVGVLAMTRERPEVCFLFVS